MDNNTREEFEVAGLMFQGDDSLEGLLEHGTELSPERIDEILSEYVTFDDMVSGLITLGASIDGAPQLNLATPTHEFIKSPSTFHNEAGVLLYIYHELNKDNDLERQRNVLERIGKDFPKTTQGTITHVGPIGRLLKSKAEKLGAPWPDEETIDITTSEHFSTDAVEEPLGIPLSRESINTSVENATSIASLVVILETINETASLNEVGEAQITSALAELRPLVNLSPEKARELLLTKLAQAQLKPDAYFKRMFPEWTGVGTKLKELLSLTEEVDLELV